MTKTHNKPTFNEFLHTQKYEWLGDRGVEHLPFTEFARRVRASQNPRNRFHNAAEELGRGLVSFIREAHDDYVQRCKNGNLSPAAPQAKKHGKAGTNIPAM